MRHWKSCRVTQRVPDSALHVMFMLVKSSNLVGRERCELCVHGTNLWLGNRGAGAGQAPAMRFENLEIEVLALDHSGYLQISTERCGAVWEMHIFV